MKKFMDEDFLLSNETAKKLYHDYAEKMPIIDYHCHINPQEIAENRKFDNITQVWLYGDHYKWRIIRACGVDEDKITGAASDRERFQMFAEALPRAIGNPLYHWTHLELKRYFGYDGVLNGETAEEVWNLCNEKLKSDELSVRGIIKSSNVKCIATTDDPADSLEWHQKIKEDTTFDVKVLPAWRPDKAMNVDKDTFPGYVEKLGNVVGKKLATFKDLLAALDERMAFFNEMGCVNCDHGMDYVMYRPASDDEVEAIYQKGLKGEAICECEAEKFKTAMMLHLGAGYAKYGWVMQIHYGALRNTNTGLFKKLGPDVGVDAISGRDCSGALFQLLDAMDQKGALPKTILYSLNPNDNAMLQVAMGCFPSAGVRNKVQNGAAWWFNDSLPGMVNHMVSYASLGVLGNFLGMLTDSRSFLSYTRHEYYRRILCNQIGEWVENGEYPDDIEYLGKMVQDISFNNTNEFFGFHC